MVNEGKFRMFNMTMNLTIVVSMLFQNANVLQAVLCLVKDLDAESLEIVADAVRVRLEAL